MAGINDVAQAAFEGAKPGPKAGTDTNEASALSAERVAQGEAPRLGSNLILDAFTSGRPTTRRERALARQQNRSQQNGR
mgnify:CR=1 FL=1